MYRVFCVCLLLNFSVGADGLDKSKEIHAKLIGDWSVDLVETVKVFEAVFGKDKERFLSRLPSVLLKLKRNQLKISEKEFVVNDGRMDYKTVLPTLNTEKNKITLTKIKGGSIISGFELFENGRMKILAESRDLALCIWHKKKLNKEEAEKTVEKILAKYKDIEIDIVRYVHINEFDALAKLLKKEPKYANYAKKSSGRTALHEACRFNKTNFVKLLLENGADPNAQIDQDVINDGGLSALHIIGRSSKTEDWDEVKEICELLIEHKADVNLKAKYDEYPLHSALKVSTTLPNEKLAIFLINNGADINFVNDIGETPIHQAFRYGVSEDFVKFMVEKKLKIPDKVSKLGMAPPAMAARSDKIEMLKLFIKHGFDLSKKNEQGGTLLHFAINNKETLKFVLDNIKGLDINADSKIYGTALRRAMATGEAEAVKVLLEYGAKIPQNYDPTQIASRPDDERRIYSFITGSRRSRRSAIIISEQKLYCIKEVHAVIKAHLEKQK